MSAIPTDVNFADAKHLGDRLLGQLDAMRSNAPIFWSAHQRAWIVLGHAQVAAGLRGGLPLSANRVPRVLSFLPESQHETRIPYTIASLRRMLISLDPPEHLRLRKLLARAFSKPIVEAYRPEIVRIIDETLAQVEHRERFDFVDEVARLIPARTILRLMGLQAHWLPRMRYWAWAVQSGLGGGGTTPEILDETEKVFWEMRAAFVPEIEARIIRPREDFISSLLAADEHGVRLSQEEVLATCYLVLIAGHDTTANTIGLGTVALAQDAAAWDYFRQVDDRALLTDAVMELSRRIAMTTTMGRVVVKDFQWEGHQLKQGEIVYLMIASANRDPTLFREPEALNFLRPQINNMTFGPGVHFCIGHLLAKVQLTEFFPALARRFSGLDLLDQDLDWGSAMNFRGLQSLNVRGKLRWLASAPY